MKSKIREEVIPCGVQLGYYSDKEIKQLSVVKIFSPTTFNTLGHPMPGGLHDIAMGPLNEKGGICSSCGNNYIKCKGHIGHIELPVPVINTLFFRDVQLLLKLGCFNCFKINIPSTSQLLFISQMKLLTNGYITQAKDLENLHFTDEKLALKPDELYEIVTEYVNDVLKYGTNICDFNEYKGGEELRQSFVSQVLARHVKRVCIYCQSIRNAVSYQQRKIIKSYKIFKDQTSTSSTTPIKEKEINRKREQNYVMTSEIKSDFQKLWNNEKLFLNYLIPILNNTKETIATDVMFLNYVVVPPNNMRPMAMDKISPVECRQNSNYQKIIFSCIAIQNLAKYMKKDENEPINSILEDFIKGMQGSTLDEKLQIAWHGLQLNIDILMDSNYNTMKLSDTQQIDGLKQIIDGKSGLIRQNMMGKRVNYAGRSVITPDPYLNIDSIGIPIEFAKTLTYPVHVTPWNVTLLRKMVTNGPNIYPGANMICYEDGSSIKISPFNARQRESLAKRLITPEGNVSGNKIIYRHVLNGDMLLVNRQPTLHKPSIMAHKAKILSGEKTLRLHYANCKAYNADFDGDEMNVHLPQDEISRSEASFLMNVSSQYLVPKDGTPLSGLIQDHVISGAKLSLRDTFLSKSEYMDLVYQALHIMKGEIKILPPTIWKPKPLWTGKQVLSTVIINLTPKNKSPVNLISTSKIPLKAWNFKLNDTSLHTSNDPNLMSEFEVIIRNGELLCGILDKKQFGSTQYGLVHAFYDIYGGEYAIQLLSCFAKLFTAYLQKVGFTLGVQDILVKLEADKKRSKIIKKAKHNIGIEAACNALGVPLDTPEDEIRANLEEAYSTIPLFRSQIDRQYKILLDKVTNNINQVCLPKGLIQPFPENNLQFMVESGAKGSTVNTMQISCLLGQIELEGKRPAMMVSGRTLPSFIPYEISPRAGGFIDGRFMTGIQPQEFFFHCMAGREGLIDTAVKTSRSGYLQRCLVKHLEGLTINYDMTVRDGDKSVIQFMYGEDGLDVVKRQYITKKQFSFLESNIDCILDKDDVKQMKSVTSYDVIQETNNEIENYKLKYNFNESKRHNPFTAFCDKIKYSLSDYNPTQRIDSLTGRTEHTKELISQWRELDEKSKRKYLKKYKKCPDPVISTYQPDAHFGSVSENLLNLVDQYTENIKKNKNKTKFKDMILYKNLLSLANPGENVGVVAAQSIGEPSTQMTLNTFHFAGRGDMNVTLGIPRLREILMMASKNIKTPSMEIPFLPNISKLEKKSNKLAKSMTKVTMADILEKVNVKEKLELSPEPHMNYELKFYFIPYHMYKNNSCVKPEHILKHVETYFLKELESFIAKRAVQSTRYIDIEQGKEKTKGEIDEDIDNGDEEMNKARAVTANEDSSDDEDDDRDVEDAVQSHKKTNQEEDNDFEEPEETEQDMIRNEDSDQDEEDVDEDTNMSKNKKSKTKRSLNDTNVSSDNDEDGDDEGSDDEDIKEVISRHNIVSKYKKDKKNHMWCKVNLWLTLKCHRIDMSNIIKTCASKSIIHEVQGIKRAIVMEQDGKHILKTDGINMKYISQHRNLLDLNKVYVNDIHYMAEVYGIEAANRVIVKEVKNVFAVYGIEVDPRHLSLVADYMTHNGTYVAMNRMGIKLNPSFIQRMTFEMPLDNLKKASINSRCDSLNAPSARIMFGQYCKQGTGIFSLRNKSNKKKVMTKG